jgi:fucose permease
LQLTTQSTKQTSALRIALAGMLSLAVVMGLGRFAFTPLMPMMLHEARINLQEASWLASANYFGYFRLGRNIKSDYVTRIK